MKAVRAAYQKRAGGGGGGGAYVLPGAQLEARAKVHQLQQEGRPRRRGIRQDMLDESGSVAKIFHAPVRPSGPTGVNLDKDIRIEQQRRSHAAQLPAVNGSSASNPSNVGRAMKILLGKESGKAVLDLPLRSDGEVNELPEVGRPQGARIRALEQRIGFLEGENENFKDLFSNQLQVLTEKIGQSENRLMSEVQQRVSLELEVKAGKVSKEVVESTNSTRLAELERLVESQQIQIVQLAEKNRQLADEISNVPRMQERMNSAISTVHQGTSEVREVDDDVQRLKQLFKKRDSDNREFEERENRKGAVLFGEVARLGKSIETAAAKQEKSLLLVQKRFEAIENRLKADERGIIAMEGRDADRFDGLSRRAEQLEKYLMELGDMSLRQRQHLDAETARQKRAREEQAQLMAEVRKSLGSADTSLNERLTGLLSQIGDRMLSEREAFDKQFQKAMSTIAMQEQAMEERNAVERERLAQRFSTLETTLRDEQNIRAQQSKELASELDARMEDVLKAMQKDQTSQSRAYKLMEDGQLRAAKSLRANMEEISAELSGKNATLEKVVRAEVKSRMRDSSQLADRVSREVSRLRQLIAECRGESGKLVDSGLKNLNTRTKKLEDTLDKVQREQVVALSRAAQSQALVNAELAGRLDGLEAREQADENETDAIKEELNRKIDVFARANSDAVGALQSVVADHKRENEEEMAKLQAKIGGELTSSNDVMRKALTQWSQDVQSEIEQLRESTAGSLDDLRKSVTKDSIEFSGSLARTEAGLSALKERIDGDAHARRVQERNQQKDIASYRSTVRAAFESEQVANCVSDLISHLEYDSFRSTQCHVNKTTQAALEKGFSELNTRVEAAEHAQALEAQSVKQSRSATKKYLTRLEDRLNVHAEVAERANACQAADMAVHFTMEKMLQSISLATIQSSASSIALEIEGTKNAFNDTISDLREDMNYASEEREAIKQRVSLVASFLEDKQAKEDEEWRKSIAEAEAADLLDEDEKGNSPTGVPDRDLTALDEEDQHSGKEFLMPDVGFPPMSEASGDA